MVEDTIAIVEEELPVDLDPVPDELEDGGVVIEAGAYEGAWALKVAQQRPACQVYAYEPATRAYKVALGKLRDFPNVVLQNVALGKRAGTTILCDRDRDGANTFGHNPECEPSETVRVLDTADVIRGLGEIALMHLNAEGDEATILERMIEAGLIEHVEMILIQWHPYDGEMLERIARVTELLCKTHEHEQRYVWGCWARVERQRDDGMA